MARRLVGIFLFVTLAYSLNGPTASLAVGVGATRADGNTAAEVAKIQTYHDQIDSWAKLHPTAVRYLSATEDDAGRPTNWKPYKTKSALPVAEDHASVWVKDGIVVATILSQTLDHTWYTDGSYFRADGSLAYREIHNYSVGYEPPFRDLTTYYSATGEVLKSICTGSDDENQKKSCDDATAKQMNDENGTLLFKKASDLPFYRLINAKH